MITIKVDVEQGTAEISGHAGYAERGKDIVCAGVSAITGALIDMVSGRGDPAWVEIGLQGQVRLRIPEESGLDLCLMMALTGWLNIQDQYPEHVKVMLPE